MATLNLVGGGPGLRFRREREDPNAIAEPSTGWRQVHRPVESGRYHFRAEFVQLRSLQLAFTEVSLGRHVSGAPPTGTIALGIPIWYIGSIQSRGRTMGELECLSAGPRDSLDILYEGAAKQLVLAFDADTFGEQFRALRQRDVPEVPYFAFADHTARRALISEASEAVRRLLSGATEPAAESEFEERIFERMIALTEPDPSPQPWRHRRRIAWGLRQYILDNIEQPIRGTDLCRAAGVSRRAIDYAFRDTFGLSPRDFIVREKLLRARHQLQQEHLDVTSVASIYGFAHFGRFAKEYRALFDELPSQTVVASRRFIA
jgi:AraC family transcriptional regulator, ethanolamine operon transcriptional activator